MAKSILSLLGIHRNRDKSRGYGEIDTKIIRFITPNMVITIGLPVLGVLLNLATVVEYFTAGEALNMIILICFSTAVFLATYNNLNIRKNAFYLQDISRIIDAKDKSPESVQRLLSKLPSKGNLFDTNHMEGCIKNIERFGHPNFTDADARMIKSKLGQRIAERRKAVTFIGGMLVMMGLIGTYIGLLHTVNEVGNVMKSMSNIGSDDASGMSNFVGALASPLQGMGLAFSASLFGISGSLLTQIYGNFCNSAQNEFIENVSRWIDDRIPKFTSAENKDGKDKIFGRAATAEDLRTWLAGFVNLSVQSNKKLGQLVQVLAISSQASLRSAKSLDQLMLTHANTQNMMADVTNAIRDIGRQSSQPPAITQIQSDIIDLKATAKEISNVIPTMANAFNSMNATATAGNAAMRESMTIISQTMHTQQNESAALMRALASLPDTLSRLTQAQETLASKLDSVQLGASVATGAAVPDPISMEMNNISSDMNALFSQMNDDNASLLKQMFGMGDGDEEQQPAQPAPSEKE